MLTTSTPPNKCHIEIAGVAFVGEVGTSQEKIYSEVRLYSRSIQVGSFVFVN